MDFTTGDDKKLLLMGREDITALIVSLLIGEVLTVFDLFSSLASFADRG